MQRWLKHCLGGLEYGGEDKEYARLGERVRNVPLHEQWPHDVRLQVLRNLSLTDKLRTSIVYRSFAAMLRPTIESLVVISPVSHSYLEAMSRAYHALNNPS